MLLEIVTQTHFKAHRRNTIDEGEYVKVRKKKTSEYYSIDKSIN